jgi:hypothetical protein
LPRRDRPSHHPPLALRASPTQQVNSSLPPWRCCEDGQADAQEGHYRGAHGGSSRTPDAARGRGGRRARQEQEEAGGARGGRASHAGGGEGDKAGAAAKAEAKKAADVAAKKVASLKAALAEAEAEAETAAVTAAGDAVAQAAGGGAPTGKDSGKGKGKAAGPSKAAGKDLKATPEGEGEHDGDAADDADGVFILPAADGASGDSLVSFPLALVQVETSKNGKQEPTLKMGQFPRDLKNYMTLYPGQISTLTLGSSSARTVGQVKANAPMLLTGLHYSVGLVCKLLVMHTVYEIYAQDPTYNSGWELTCKGENVYSLEKNVETGTMPLAIIDLLLTNLSEGAAAVESQFRYVGRYTGLLPRAVELTTVWLLGLQQALLAQMARAPVLKAAFVTFHLDGLLGTGLMCVLTKSAGTLHLVQHMFEQLLLARIGTGAALSHPAASAARVVKRTLGDGGGGRGGGGPAEKKAKYGGEDTPEPGRAPDPPHVYQGKDFGGRLPHFLTCPAYVYKAGDCPIHGPSAHGGNKCNTIRKLAKYLARLAQIGVTRIPAEGQSYKSMIGA